MEPRRDRSLNVAAPVRSNVVAPTCRPNCEPLEKEGVPPYACSQGGRGDAGNARQQLLSLARRDQFSAEPDRPHRPSWRRRLHVASTGWDELFTHYPLVIVFAEGTQDVVNALTWARHNDVALRVRSGRHSLEGWSNVDNGIVIDVSELKSAQIDTVSRTATVGAGLNQMEAVTTLGKQGFAAPPGTEGTVGLAGATLGGGFGLLTRSLGMACDNLMAAEVVVTSGADGAEAITVDQKSNSDLLWALRGAGNGNFGIVTSLTDKVHPLTRVKTWLTGRPPTGDPTSIACARSRRSTTPAMCSTTSRASRPRRADRQFRLSTPIPVRHPQGRG